MPLHQNDQESSTRSDPERFTALPTVAASGITVLSSRSGRLSAELDNYAHRRRRQQQQLSESESESVSLPVASAKVGRKMLILSLAAQTKRFQHLLD